MAYSVSNFAQMPIFQELNYFKFMQMNYHRRPPSDVSKKDIKMKTSISQEPLNEIDPSLCQNVSHVLTVPNY